ncbi:MAG: VTT domain-containing protein [Planctomycetota bacterium]|nr:VTT domain-containing protein [Planctomycetota bacterium]
MRLLLTGLVFIAVLAVPFFVWGNLFSEDVQVIQENIRDYGVWPGLAGIFLLVADILLPIPATAVMAALGLIYGPLLGGVVAAAGSFLAGAVPYLCCRTLGRGAGEWIVGSKELERAERLFGRYGGWAVALSRWLPLLPEVVACFAGLVRMPGRKFFAALACGSIPMGFAFAAMGEMGKDKPALTIVLSAVVPALLWLIVGRILTRLSLRD